VSFDLSPMTLIPPVVPIGYSYTPYYCEENIYLLANTFSQDPSISQAWEISVVFISNRTKTVALWNQKLCVDPEYPVLWDYHCVLVLRSRKHDTASSLGNSEQSSASWIYDYDSCLSLMPQPWLGKYWFCYQPWLSNGFRLQIRLYGIDLYDPRLPPHSSWRISKVSKFPYSALSHRSLLILGFVIAAISGWYLWQNSSKASHPIDHTWYVLRVPKYLSRNPCGGRKAYWRL